MKHVIAVLSLVTLTGCSTLIDGITGKYHNYDAVEYNLAVDLVVRSRGIEPRCSDAVVAKKEVQELGQRVDYFLAYTEGRPYNKRTNELAKKIKDMVTDTEKRDAMSPFFCRERAKNIVKAAEILRGSSGEKRE
jgi:hypothetical protein